MERKLVANYLVPDDEVWVSPETWERPFSLKSKESTVTDTQHTQAKMPSWGDVTKGITFSTVGERDVAAEVFSRVARHFGCA